MRVRAWVADAPLLAVAFVCDDRARTAITEAVRRLVQIRFVDDLQRAEALIRAGGVSLFIIHRADAERGEQHPALKRIHAEWPDGAIVIVTTGHDGTPLLDAAGVGANADLHVDDRQFADRMCKVLRQSAHRARRSAIALQIVPLVAPRVRQLMRTAIVEGDRAQTVRQFAGGAGMARKTLDRHLRKSLPFSARQLLGWGRLVSAAICLEDTRATVRDVTTELGFSSPAAFRNLLQRFTRLTPTELRGRGGAAHLVTRILEILAARRP